MEYDNNSSHNILQEQEENTLSLSDIWALCIGHWKWFALSLAACLLIASLYILKTVPVFTRSASVLIKEDRKSGSVSGDISSSISRLGMGMSQVNVNNEIVNFTSPDLMLQVVKNLHLDVDYMVPNWRFKRTIYGSSLPVQVDFLSLGRNESASLSLEQKDSTSVVLSHFVRSKEKLKSVEVPVSYGDTVDTPLGRILVTRSDYAYRKYDSPILVTRSGLQGRTRNCLSRLSAKLNGNNTTVINLSYKDVNTQRAEDVLQMIINVYNENWIKD